jgi:hypothetical protein
VVAEHEVERRDVGELADESHDGVGLGDVTGDQQDLRLFLFDPVVERAERERPQEVEVDVREPRGPHGRSVAR